MSDIQWTGLAFGVIYALCVLVAPIDQKKSSLFQRFGGLRCRLP